MNMDRGQVGNSLNLRSASFIPSNLIFYSSNSIRSMAAIAKNQWFFQPTKQLFPTKISELAITYWDNGSTRS